MSFRLWLIAVGLLFSIALSAQKMKRVDAEYIYHAPENVSLEEAKRIALERAKLQAIADAFGMVVSQSNFTTVANRNGKSDVDFFSLGGSEVKGEWIETIGEPEYSISYERNMLVVKVSVKGKAREMVSAQIDIVAKVLRNGTEDKFESDEFRSGDDLYLYFQSPVDGYLNVYLLDETSQTVFCLLPYRRSDEPFVFVKHDMTYVFFSQEKAVQNASMIDEYVMTCDKMIEQNTIYILFSPNQFVKANSCGELTSMPRQLSYKDFQKWLTEVRKKDSGMQVALQRIVIKK